MSNAQEKRAGRADYYREKASNAEKESMDAWERSNKAVRYIPPGQPIHVGHHSERSHRNAIAKSHKALDHMVAASKKADYYLQKAEAAENNNAIYNNDDDAVEKLEKKLAKLLILQERMKAVNKIIRNKKLDKEQKKEKIVELGLTPDKAEALLEPDFVGQIGYPNYELTANNAVIRNTRLRLEKVKKLKAREYKEYMVNGYKVCEDPEEDRFQIFFGFKPDQEIRKSLKDLGYRWTPSIEAWQCGLTNRWRIEEGKKILESMPAHE